MISESRMPLLINVARLYYENGFNQSEIAHKLGISRPYVSKLLNMAKEENVVTIKIEDPLKVESSLEQTIRSYFQLRRVIVTPTKIGENSLFSLGEAAAKYLDSIIKDGDTVMFGWGRTMYSVAQRLIPRNDLRDVTLVAMGGIPSNFTQNTYAVECVTKCAEAWSGAPLIMPAPIMIRNEAVRNGFLAEKEIHGVMHCMKQANVAVFTLGDMTRSSFWTQKGAMTDAEWQTIVERGAVGDVCLHILDSSGKVCYEDIDQMVISLPLSQLKQKDYRIGIAAGREKIDVVYASLKGGIVNALIIDEDIAKAVVEFIHS